MNDNSNGYFWLLLQHFVMCITPSQFWEHAPYAPHAAKRTKAYAEKADRLVEMILFFHPKVDKKLLLKMRDQFCFRKMTFSPNKLQSLYWLRRDSYVHQIVFDLSIGYSGLVPPLSTSLLTNFRFHLADVTD